ncbi:hypothetical protein GCM10027074_62570 [Streptomyces deserti]
MDHLAGAGQVPCVIGLFGDSMQKIYRSGVGAVQHAKLTPITKHENYRCSRPVIDVLNKMRPQLIQRASGEQQEGEVHLFLNTHASPGPPRLAAAEATLASKGWSSENTKYLLLTHRGIAGTLEYASLLEQYRQLGSHGPDDLMARTFCPFQEGCGISNAAELRPAWTTANSERPTFPTTYATFPIGRSSALPSSSTNSPPSPRSTA